MADLPSPVARIDFAALAEAMERVGGPNSSAATADEQRAARHRLEDERQAGASAFRAARRAEVQAELIRRRERQALIDAGEPYLEE